MEIKESPKTKEQLIEEYSNLDENTHRILDVSYETVSETKASSNRLEEIKLFCKKMGYKKIGISFCKGLRQYASQVDSYLSSDFEVLSVCCNVCGLTKSDISVKKINEDNAELACNPLGQAAVINGQNVDFIIKCGFCLGHDIIFSKNITAPATTIIVKDRCNNHRTADIFKD